ncbi:hypothetical protein ACPYO6_05845 [Georgenia sp. Z1344]|uniref:hypothetical protein n=1 Tax=Georgenia sp. Z1344 TaxID=3416706 RepID=UPI003CE9F13F
MLPLRQRAASIVLVALAAPVCAEMLQAYLAATGDPGELAFATVFLAPLYGGAALLIRDLAVRTGRGWAGILLLAAAFGLAMTGVIDLSMFAGDRPDVSYWDELREPTMIAPLGFSAYATLVWVLGHVSMSVGAPLAIHRALAPRHEGRPLLGRFGTVVAVAAWVAVAVAIHSDGRDMYGYAPSIGQVVGVLAGVAALVALAMSPAGRPLRARGRGSAREVGSRGSEVEQGERHPAVARPVRTWVIVLAGILGKVLLDLTPPAWGGFAFVVAVVVVAAWLLARVSTRRRWGAREGGILGASLVVGGVLVGMLAPLPGGVTMGAKIAQSVVLLGAAIGVLAVVLRRERPRAATPPTTSVDRHSADENVSEVPLE